jgi:beta-glucosidase-like glycosyl hydrolase
VQVRLLAGRVLTRKFASGLFDAPLTAAPAEAARSTDASELALEAATQGAVLLQNTGNLLPLKLPKSRIAVIGPHVVCKLSATEDSSDWYVGTSLSQNDASASRVM